MHRARLTIYPDMRLRAEVPLIAFARPMHLRVTLVAGLHAQRACPAVQIKVQPVGIKCGNQLSAYQDVRMRPSHCAIRVPGRFRQLSARRTED